MKKERKKGSKESSFYLVRQIFYQYHGRYLLIKYYRKLGIDFIIAYKKRRSWFDN